MSLPCRAWVAGGLLLAVGLRLPAAPSQEPDKPPTSTLKATEPVTRQVYAARGATAADLANALTLHFQGEPFFRAVADPASNSVLLSGPKSILDDAVAVLHQIDRRPRTVHLEVLLVTLASGDAKALDGVELSGTTQVVLARIRELQQKGMITNVKIVELTALERQMANARVSESRPYVTGVVFGGRGGGPGGGSMSRSINYREVGTNVQVIPDVGRDGLVSLHLKVDDSHMRAAEDGVAIGADEKGTAVPATEFVTSTLETNLRVRPGQMVLAEGTKAGSKSGQAQTVILVTAGTDDAGPKDGK